MNDTSNETVIDDIDAVDYAILSVTGIFVSITIALTSYLIYKHWINYTRPNSQRCIVRILFMVPLYAIYSYLCLFFYEYQAYLALLRDCYEAYALYMFFVLCIEYAGGWQNMEEAFDQQPERGCVEPLCCVKTKPSANLLRWCQRGILQYALIRPLVTFVSAILLKLEYYEEGDWALDRGYIYATILNNLGVTFSLYFLVLFYQVGKNELKPYKPLLKFSVIKGIVFFCYWQSVAVMVLVALDWLPSYKSWNSQRTAVTLQNLLICYEMFVFSILHLWAFPYDIYQIKALSQAPFVHEFEVGQSKLGRIKKAVKDSISQKDFVQDTIDSFVPEKVKKRKKKSKFDKVQSEEVEDSNGVKLQSMSEDENSSETEEVSIEVGLEESGMAEDSDKIRKVARR
eukprot:TRINITY_DN6004_c0_g1_i1.p1 TRINITY_DN6004_c0_g1~~TRINITY_DN6004_c0_g1_i1.p1  ORF type:complete len:415 (+),score=46.49 TRINITY_DN6004_c0_g1_i1:51-1247(+)